MLHKALCSGHNDHNYFEIAHTIKYVDDMVGNNLKLYSLVDNHDVERIYTNPCTKLIAALGKIHQNTPALCSGDYKQLELQTPAKSGFRQRTAMKALRRLRQWR